MARYGLFRGSSKEPSQIVEGDFMQQDKEYVTIKKQTDPNNAVFKQVGAIRLAPRELVKKMDDYSHYAEIVSGSENKCRLTRPGAGLTIGGP
jgi:hypothetical protein